MQLELDLVLKSVETRSAQKICEFEVTVNQLNGNIHEIQQELDAARAEVEQSRDIFSVRRAEFAKNTAAIADEFRALFGSSPLAERSRASSGVSGVAGGGASSHSVDGSPKLDPGSPNVQIEELRRCLEQFQKKRNEQQATIRELRRQFHVLSSSRSWLSVASLPLTTIWNFLRHKFVDIAASDAASSLDLQQFRDEWEEVLYEKRDVLEEKAVMEKSASDLSNHYVEQKLAKEAELRHLEEKSWSVLKQEQDEEKHRFDQELREKKRHHQQQIQREKEEAESRIQREWSKLRQKAMIVDRKETENVSERRHFEQHPSNMFASHSSHPVFATTTPQRQTQQHAGAGHQNDESSPMFANQALLSQQTPSIRRSGQQHSPQQQQEEEEESRFRLSPQQQQNNNNTNKSKMSS